VAFAFFSILFASAFYFQVISGEGLEQQKVRSAQDSLISQIGRQKEYFSALAERLQKLAIYSKEQAKIESERGGTCAGSSGKGAGPLWAKRMWQADQFGRIAEYFSELSGKLNGEVDSVISLASDATIDTLSKQLMLKQRVPLIAAYAERGDVRRMLADLDAQQVYEIEGFPKDGRYCYKGKCFGGKACKDSRLVERIRAVRLLGDPKPLALDMEVYDSSNVQQNIKVVIGLWKSIFIDDGDGVVMTSDHMLALGVGGLFDFGILIMGFLIGAEQRAQSKRRLSRSQFTYIAERFDDLLNIYSDIFPVDRLPPEKSSEDEGQLHRIQLVIDEVTRPAGTDKVILLPGNQETRMRSRRRPTVEDSSERRLDAVIEVLNVLDAGRLIGEPQTSFFNRHKEFCGYNTYTVATWYGLDPDSVEWFKVFIVAPTLMMDSTGIVIENEAESKLPAHLRVMRKVILIFRPNLFAGEERFYDALEPRVLADHLHGRCRVRGRENTEESNNELSCEIVLFPELSVKDRVLDHFLRDDDHGLHQDLEDLSPGWTLFIPYRHYRLGYRSSRALLSLVETERGSSGPEFSE